MPRGLFITGTDTDVGKTYVGSLIARSLVATGRHVGVYKPVASGCRREGSDLIADDALALWEAAGRPGGLAEVCPQRFEAPVAPSLAARQEGTTVDTELLRSGIDLCGARSEIVLVEGAGGLMSPLSDEQSNAELAVTLGYPLVVVSANRLGTINATLQTLITAGVVCSRLPVVGVVLNDCSAGATDASRSSNRAELASRLSAPLLATVAWGDDFDTPIDWWNLARPA